MKNLVVALILIFFFSNGLMSQKENLKPCGTEGYKSEWLKKYQANPHSYAVKEAVTVNVPITVYRVGRNNGSGKYGESALLRAMCTLEKDFEGSDLEFYIKEKIKDIDDSDFYQHDEVVDGGLKMHQYNDDRSINCYIVETAAGNCGYNLPWAGVCVADDCAGVNDHTWAHEMGHALSLPHPFLGWEGGVSYNGSVSHDFNNPAPDTVYYDYTFFKDTLILDTLIIDTTLVEKMDGSNCQFAADGFCDTKPDYLAQRWGCRTDSMSVVEQTDPDGVKFFSDGSLIMSYALDNCSDRFTNDQMAAMRANAMDVKGAYTSTDLVFLPPDDAASIVLNVPIQDETIYFRDVDFQWSQDNPEQYYLFQIGVEPSFSVLLYDTIVASNAFTLSEVDDSWGTLFWRVKAFTANDWCGDFANGSSFKTTDVSATKDIIDFDFEIYPNIINSESQKIYLSNSNNIKRYQLIDISGRVINNGEVHSNQLNLNGVQLTNGMYFLKFDLEGSTLIKKLVVSR